MTTAATPNGWARRRLRFDARINPVKSGLRVSDETEVSFVPMDAVGEWGGLRLDEQRAVDEVYNGYTYFCDEDVVIAKITPCFENGKGALAAGLTNGVGFGTTELHVVRSREGLDPRFLFYITIEHDFRRIGTAEMLGAGGQKRVPERFLKDWRPPLPPVETQRRIAAFLDEKTTRIDALIAKIGGSASANTEQSKSRGKSLLELLFEYRAALITSVVTGTLEV
jgi:type I restriction enzyme S subunit